MKIPVLAFLIKKSINTELLIERLAAFYVGETQIRDTTNKGDQKMA